MNFRNYNVNDGLASSTVYYIHQDRQGFMWFATESGVNRYDGQAFQTFSMDDGLSDNEVLQIKEDSKGRTWFLTLNGKLSYYYKNKFYNPKNDSVLAKTFCRASFVSFFEDSRNRLWFSTNQRQIVMIDGSKVKIFYSEGQLFTNSFLAENDKSEILIFSKNNVYKLRENSGAIKLYPNQSISFKTLLYNKNRSISLITKSGLMVMKEGRLSIKQTIPEHVYQHGISHFFKDDAGDLWINTMGGGAFVIDSLNKVPEKQLLKGKYLTHSHMDIDGNIWISTIGYGVFMLPRSANNMLHYSTANGLADNSIYSILRTPDKKLLLGLRNGNMNVISGGKISYRSLKKQKIVYDPIKKLVYDSTNHSTWFAANNSMGEILPNTNRVRYLKERDNSTYALKSFSISKSGKLAIALAAGIEILKNKNSELLFETPNLGNSNIHFPSRAYSVFYDSDEGLWFSNINGLNYLRNDSLNRLYENSPVLEQRITDITELPDKTIICATYGFGIYILKNQKWHRSITTRDGLGSNICKKVFYANNFIWVITGNGISRISKDYRTITNFQKENGLLSNEINDAIISNDSVYVASNSGLSIFSASSVQQKRKPIPLVLNYIWINNRPVDITRKVNLSPRSNNLTINFIGIDYTNPSKVVYEYRLKDELKWTITSNNTIEFGSLEAGDYHLQIRAKGINSGWSRPIDFYFMIEPPIWKTAWFILLLSIFLFPALFILINGFYKNKRLKEQEKLLAKTKIIALEQQALQAMMNPHFIFNVMNSIQHFINTKDTVMANRLLTGFARLIRKNLEICNKSYISLEEEFSYLTLYLSLEKLRFGDKMNYFIDIDPLIDREETFIPSMLLQPFVENAIWHGIMPKESEGTIHITIVMQNESLLNISIVDDGIGIDRSVKLKNNDHISRGMELTQERINLLNKFDSPINLKVEQLSTNGTKVTINIPI